MKLAPAIPLILVLSASGFVNAQSDGMDMKGRDIFANAQSGGMDMKGMDMRDMGNKPQTHESKPVTHKTNAVVEAVDVANGEVTLAHEPIKSLAWPAMIMGFSVTDKALFKKLPVGKKVEVEFVQLGSGSDYMLTSVK
jgi:Cu(I)/Ag(I) efflux system periplasmic protein CusF